MWKFVLRCQFYSYMRQYASNKLYRILDYIGSLPVRFQFCAIKYCKENCISTMYSVMHWVPWSWRYSDRHLSFLTATSFQMRKGHSFNFGRIILCSWSIYWCLQRSISNSEVLKRTIQPLDKMNVMVNQFYYWVGKNLHFSVTCAIVSISFSGHRITSSIIDAITVVINNPVHCRYNV